MLAELRWLLRDHAGLRVAAAVPSDAAPLVITPVEDQPLLKDRYSGAEFPILQTWRPTGLGDFNAYLRWVLYREAKTAPETAEGDPVGGQNAKVNRACVTRDPASKGLHATQYASRNTHHASRTTFPRITMENTEPNIPKLP